MTKIYPLTIVFESKNHQKVNTFIGTRLYQICFIRTLNLIDQTMDDINYSEWKIVKHKSQKCAVTQDPDVSKSETVDNMNYEKLKFYYGNSLTHIVEGVIHIFKQNSPIELETAMMGTDQNSTRLSHLNILCMLRVPIRFTTHRLLKFLSPFAATLQTIRIIKDESPNFYMVLLKFNSASMALEFYKTLQGVPLYNSPYYELSRQHQPLPNHEVCQLAFVSQIQYLSSDNLKNEIIPEKSNGTAKNVESNNSTFPPNDTTELPKCIVCMERMEESVEGILTVLCNHSFHAHCMSQWRDNTCPVCRFSQTGIPSPTHNNGDRSKFRVGDTLNNYLSDDAINNVNESAIDFNRLFDTTSGGKGNLISSTLDYVNLEADDTTFDHNVCMESGCGSSSDLWICLICGNIGCGRYLRGHASKHYEESSHTFAMEVESGRVWDYLGDNYVHRLIQNRVDGKVVEYVRPNNHISLNLDNHDNLRSTVEQQQAKEDDLYRKKGQSAKQTYKHKKRQAKIQSLKETLGEYCSCPMELVLNERIIDETSQVSNVNTEECNADHAELNITGDSITKNLPDKKMHDIPVLCQYCGKFRCTYDSSDDYSTPNTTDSSENSDEDVDGKFHMKNHYPSDIVRSQNRLYSEDENDALTNVYACENEKIDSISLEYSYLMSQQLQAQRQHFKRELESAENDFLREIILRDTKVTALQKRLAESSALSERQTRDYEKLDKKYKLLSNKFECLLKDHKEERVLNSTLAQNQSELQKKYQDLESKFNQALLLKETELTDLKEQLRDMMFHFQAQKTIENSANGDNLQVTQEELQGGCIIVPTPSEPSSTKSHNRRRRKNKG